MSPEVQAAVIGATITLVGGVVLGILGWIARAVWKRRERFTRALPLRGVVTAHEPERLEVPLRGRHEELVRLEGALGERNLIVISGWAGVGKTTLGQALARRLASAYTCTWVDCKVGMRLESLINALANYYGTNYEDFARILEKDLAKTPQQGIAALVSALDCQKNILFLDDFQLVDDTAVINDLLRALRVRPKQARTVVLTREADKLKEFLRPEGIQETCAEELALGDLDRESAFELLRDRSLGERSEDELERLYNKTRGHPKGLELCAGLVKSGMAIEEIERLPLFERSGDEEKSLRRILKETEKRLSGDELRLLQRCSVFDEAFSGRAMSYIYQTERWRVVAPGLESKMLLGRADGQYELHPLLREYFYRGLKDARLAHGFAGEHFLDEVGRVTEESVRLALRLKAHHHFHMAQDERRVIELFRDVYDPLVMAGRWAEATQICELTLEASRNLKDERAESACLNELGNMRSRQGQLDEAMWLYTQSLEIDEQAGDIQGAATTYMNLGIVHADKGEWDRAIELYEKSLELKEQVGDIHGMAETYTNLGLVYADKGKWDRAIELYHKSLEIDEQVGDVHGMAKTYTNLGNVYATSERWDEAIELYEKDLEISERLGDIHGMSQTYSNLGSVYADKGEWDRAIELCHKSLEISERLGDIHGMAQTYNNLGNVYASRERWDEAIELYEKDLEISERLGDIHGMAQTYGNLGLVYADKGEWDRAIELYEKSLEISERLGDIHGMAQTWGNLASLYETKEDHATALEYVEKALEVFKQLGSFEVQEAEEHVVRIKEKMKEGSKEES